MGTDVPPHRLHRRVAHHHAILGHRQELKLHDSGHRREGHDRDGVRRARALGGTGSQVLHDQRQHPVVGIVGNVELALNDFLGRVIVRAIVHGVAAGGAVHGGVERLRERRAPLDDVVRQQPEHVLLGEHDGLVVERAVLEPEHETTLDPVAAHDLGEIALGELLVVRRPQGRKRSRHTFGVADRDRARRGGAEVRDRENKAEHCHSGPAHWAPR